MRSRSSSQDENLDVYQRVDSGDMERVPRARRELTRVQPIRRVNCNEYSGIEKVEESLKYLTPEKAETIVRIIKNNKQVFARDKFDVGCVRGQEAKIRLMEYRYISKKPYRCSIPDQEEIESQIGQLLKAGLIEESSSPFAAPVTLAYKKEDGRKTRLCIDFRELNKLVVPEAQPFPRIEDIMVRAVNCQWFSTFDIHSAFWSVPISKRDRDKTAFVTQTGHYQWVRLPFGLKISPCVFQRIISNALRNHGLQQFCMNYIDDVLVFSKTFEEHTRHVKKLLGAMEEEGFKLKLSKCHFAKSRVNYLGHIIEKNSVRPARDNLRAIRDFPTPENRKNVRQLLEKVNFYYKYIEKAAETLEPLHNLLRKAVSFTWTEDCEKAFTKIKEYLCSAPILSIYDQNRPCFIFTDASGIGLGAILKQPQEDGLLHPVAYFSRRLRPAELKRKAIHLEFWQSRKRLFTGNIG